MTRQRETRPARSYLRKKPRAVRGQLRNLTHAAREKLHRWFREDGGIVPYKEIRRRLAAEFDVHVRSISTIGEYYRQKYNEITNPAAPGAGAEADGTTASAGRAEQQEIIVRISAPAGSRCEVIDDSATGVVRQ